MSKDRTHPEKWNAKVAHWVGREGMRERGLNQERSYGSGGQKWFRTGFDVRMQCLNLRRRSAPSDWALALVSFRKCLAPIDSGQRGPVLSTCSAALHACGDS